MQNVEFGMVWAVRSDPRSTAMSPFDRAPTTSYFVGFRVIASYLSKVAYFNLPHLHLASPLGVMPVEFRRDLRHPKTRVPRLSIARRCLRDSAFSRFDTIPACDGRTDGRTDRHTTTAYTEYSVAR